MGKISSNRLNMDLIKGMQKTILSESDLTEILSSKKYTVLTTKGVNQARIDAFQACKGKSEKEQEVIISNFKNQMDLLTRKEVIFDNGKRGDIFLADLEKLQGIEKSMKNTLLKSHDEEEEEEVSNENIDNEKKVDDEEDNGISEEELEILTLINEVLEETGDVDEKELGDEEGFSDDETKAILQSLVDKGLIEARATGSGLDVLSITDEGMALLNNGSEEEDDEDVENQPMEEDDQDGIEDDPEMGDNQDGSDFEEEDDENQNAKLSSQEEMEKKFQEGAGEEGEEEEGSQNVQPQQQQNQQQLSPEELAQMAAEVDDATLQAYIENPQNPDKYKQIAQAELEKRKQGGGEDQEGGPNIKNMEGPDEEVDEEEEFKSFSDKYLDDHDKEDLEDMVKTMILTTPSKKKDLKNHFREDYQKKNGGNKITGKINSEEFEEYIDEYLNAMTFSDLKNYAMDIMNKNPDSKGKFMKTFKSYKDNGML